MNTKFSSYDLPRKRRRTSLNKCVLSNDETNDSSGSLDALFVQIESRPGGVEEYGFAYGVEGASNTFLFPWDIEILIACAIIEPWKFDAFLILGIVCHPTVKLVTSVRFPKEATREYRWSTKTPQKPNELRKPRHIISYLRAAVVIDRSILDVTKVTVHLFKDRVTGHPVPSCHNTINRYIRSQTGRPHSLNKVSKLRPNVGSLRSRTKDFNSPTRPLEASENDARLDIAPRNSPLKFPPILAQLSLS